MKQLITFVAAVAMAATFTITAHTGQEIVTDTAPKAEAIMRGCRHGANWSLCTSYDPHYKPWLDRQAVYVKCDGWWPISDYYAYGPLVGANQYSIVNCGPHRQPKFIRIVQA